MTLLTTPTMTAAERQRRHRAAQHEARDEVRAFLNAVVAFGEASARASGPREDDEPAVKAESWPLYVASLAHDLIDKQDATDTSPKLHIRVRGATEDDLRRLFASHERAFERWVRVPGNATQAAAREAASPAVETAELSLSWASDLLARGLATSPIMHEGLRACKRLIERPRPRATAAAFEAYTRQTDASDYCLMLRLLDEGHFPTAEDYLADDEKGSIDVSNN